MRVALCQKDNLLRESLEALLTAEGYEVVASVGKASTCLSAAKVHNVRAIVVVVPGLLNEDLEKFNEAHENAPWHLLAIANSAEEIEGLEHDKFVPTNANRAKLTRTLTDLASREQRPQLIIRERKPIYSRVTILTPREHEIALKVAEGLSNRDIAAELQLAEQTVKNLVSVIMRKMSCKNRTQVALKLSGKSDNRGQ